MQALMLALMVPLMLLNFFGGIASGIWLGFLGEWWAIGYGLLGIVTSHFLLGFAMMPGIIFGAPAIALAQKGRLVLAFPFLLLSQIYTYAIIVVWCGFVFFGFVSHANQYSFWPLLIWSYGVALGPLMYMAQRESQAGTGEASTMTTFFAQIAYVVMAIFAATKRMAFVDLMLIFSAIMFIGMLIQVGFAVAITREQKRLGFM